MGGREIKFSNEGDYPLMGWGTFLNGGRGNDKSCNPGTLQHSI